MPVNPFIQIFTALGGDCNETQNIFFSKTNQNMLTPEDKEKCEGLLTKEECNKL